MLKCQGCGKVFNDDARFCDRCGTRLVPETPQPQPNVYVMPQAQAQPNMVQPAAPQKRDFTTAPTSINVMSIIGFVLSFLCLAFVWMPEVSFVVFPIAIVALVLCTIVKAMKYNNLFSKIGFIVGLIVTIISAIVFGITFYEMVW